jgi:hypothetical protein
MRLLELLRPQQRINQIGEQEQRGNTGNHVVHRFYPQSLSQALVKTQQTAKKAIPSKR